MRRIAILGVSGSGKSTFARAVSHALGVPYVEIDGLFHGPDWTPRSEFLDDLDHFTALPSWTIELQYRSRQTLVEDRADTLVWLDYRFPVVFGRLLRRTIRRALRHEELWNGNVEPPLHTMFTDPEHVLWWALKTRHGPAEAVEELASRRPELAVVRLRSPRAGRRWLAEVEAADPDRAPR